MSNIDRDLSWLYFNGRVLQEAENPEVPLYERIKFVAIFSSNLDEFFKVRIPHLRNFKLLKKKEKKKLGIRPKKALKDVLHEVSLQQKRLGKAVEKDIIPALRENGIHLIQNEEFSKAQKEAALNFFEENLEGEIFCQKIDEGEVLPFLRNQGLYLLVSLGKEKKREIALVDIPSNRSARFVQLPSEKPDHYCYAYLDDIIRCNLDRIFQDQKIRGIYAIKVSRDAELYIDDSVDIDLAAEIIRRIPDREKQEASRLLYDERIDQKSLNALQTFFELSQKDLVQGGRYHNMSDFFSFPNPLKKVDLVDQKQEPLQHPDFINVKDYFARIRFQDRLISVPYQSFDPVVGWLNQAATDRNVTEIKITLYRVSTDSAVANSLLKALEKGKKVTAFIEVQARFDEESNYYWGNRLKQAGAVILYSIPRIKVHSKIFLIKRKELKRIKKYVYLGTGNFNEKTAKLYGDYGLMTSDSRLTEEVEEVFRLLERKILRPECKHLLVSPFTCRSTFESLINKEIKNAKKGRKAYIILKMNSLEDDRMIEKLYEASQQGVKINLIIRGICRLVPGKKGLSENIRAISIIDRYLEHARVYIFGNNRKEKMYVASADWMTRNLDRRVEVCFPIYSESKKKIIRDMMDMQLADNVKARDLSNPGTNKMVKRKGDKIRSQAMIYDYFR